MIRYQSMILCQAQYISCHAPFRQGSIVSQYIDVYVSQSEVHILQKAGSESMKTCTHISDIDSRCKIGTFEILLEVYQLTLLGVSINPPSRVDTFDNVC